MGKSQVNILMASLVGGLLTVAAARAEPVKPDTDGTTPTTEEVITDPLWEGELPPDEELWEEPGEGIIGREGEGEWPTEEYEDEVIYYLMDSPTDSGEQPPEGEYVELSAQSGVYHNPEPGSLALGGLGLLGLLGFGWRRRRA